MGRHAGRLGFQPKVAISGDRTAVDLRLGALGSAWDPPLPLPSGELKSTPEPMTEVAADAVIMAVVQGARKTQNG
jgi:hypothetical protein